MLYSTIVKLLTLLPVTINAISLESSPTSMSNSEPSSMSMTDFAAYLTLTDTSPYFSLPWSPAVGGGSQGCIPACLAWFGRVTGCGDFASENCACLSAPADALDYIAICVGNICIPERSTSAFARSAVGSYKSYCESVYGTAIFSKALLAMSNPARVASSE